MTQYILNLSYGKDSLACLGAIKYLGWPLDRMVHAEVWATDTIPADLPPMVEFKKKADAIIKDRYGIEVEHICALKTGGGKQTYESMFYHELQSGQFVGTIKGFPQTIGSWCKKLKYEHNGVDIRRYILSSIAREETPRRNIWLSDNECELVYKSIENRCVGQLYPFTICSSRERERERRRSRKSCNTSVSLRTSLHESRSTLTVPA